VMGVMLGGGFLRWHAQWHQPMRQSEQGRVQTEAQLVRGHMQWTMLRGGFSRQHTQWLQLKRLDCSEVCIVEMGCKQGVGRVRSRTKGKSRHEGTEG